MSDSTVTVGRRPGRARARAGKPAALLTGIALWVAATAVALLASASSVDRPGAPLDLSSGWQFALDPADQGLALGWQTSTATFPTERSMRTGLPLSDQGVEHYTGISWFRRRVTVPDGWQRLFLGFGAVDVACDLYVNGELRGHFDDQGLGQRAALVDLTGTVHPGEELLIAFRVRGTGGFGGIKQAVKLGNDPAQVMTGKQYELYLHDTHPDWLLPAWTGGGPLAWTVAGVEGAQSKTVVAADGSFSPWPGAYGVSFWLYDPAAGGLVPFGAPSARLDAGSSPLPVFTFRAGNWVLREEVGVSGPPSTPFVTSAVTLQAGPHAALLFAAVRPFTASGGMAALPGLSARQGGLWLGSQPALLLSGAPSQAGVATGEDVSVDAVRGRLPSSAVVDGAGLIEGLMRAEISPGETLSFLAPGTPGARLPAAPADLDALSQRWQQRTHQVTLDLPDAELQNAYYASLAYMLAEQRGQLIHPGPLAHDAFWVRDAAMIGYALERAGLADAVRGSAEATLAAIGPGGAVTAVTHSDGTLDSAIELDAPGQAAFSLVEFARFSGDEAFLAGAYPRIKAALIYALSLRDGSGLLPPNESAEDLGAFDQRHYWDDLWLMTGLQDAQWAAARTGHNEDVQLFQAGEDAVRQALLRAIAASGVDYIPNNETDLQGSSMARGSSPALWPLPVLDPASPLVQSSFRRYDAQLIEPFQGAYHHLYGQWWPYAGLQLAHDFLFLGMRQPMQRILDYTLAHQTAPGLFAWAEGVDSATGGFGEGDMPHGWASAELVNLLRDMLLYERDGRLIVGAGVPPSWAGKTFAIRQAPTEWGLATVEVTAEGDVRVTGIRPPDGIELALPFPARLAG